MSEWVSGMKQHLVQISPVDGHVEYLSSILATIRSVGHAVQLSAFGFRGLGFRDYSLRMQFRGVGFHDSEFRV